MTVQRKYNRENGLIFNESILRTSTATSAFLRRCRGQLPKATLSPCGADALEKAAMRAVLCNLAYITPGVLRCVPEAIIRRIWNAVERSSLTSIQTWQLFTSTLPDNPPSRVHKQREPRPDPRMLNYLPISSDDFIWLSALVISNFRFPHDELLRLGGLRNLAYLSISYQPGSSGMSDEASIDDGVIRGWSRQAATGGAFPRLRLLFFRGQKYLTGDCFRYLDAFPPLEGVGFSDCRRMEVGEARELAKRHRWRVSSAGFDKYARDHIADATNEERPNWSALVESYNLSIHEDKMAEKIAEKKQPPLLMLSLGRETGSGSFSVDKPGFMWFERAAETSRDEAERTQEAVPAPPSAKRRKLRDGKRRDLNELLGGL